MLRCAGLALAILALLPGVASATSSVAVFSDPGDFLGEGRQDVFGAGAEISTSTDALVSGDHVVVRAYDPALGGWKLTFAAPSGERLEARNYVDAQDATFREPGHAGLEATADAQRGCNAVYGRFEVRDIVRRADGSIRRLWVVFQLHCEGKVPATWGEVRIGMAPSAATPTIVRWPEQDSWQTATTVPVRFEGAAALAGVALAGDGAADFVADDGGCRATACTVQLAFRATTGGSRRALLRLTDAAGAVHDVVLEGFRHGGISRTVVEDVLKPDLEPDRPSRLYVHEPPSSRFSGVLYEHGLVIVHVEDAERWWEARLWPGAAGWHAGRTYSDVTSGSGGGERPAMYLFGRATACNPSSEGGSFTVHSISREPDGGLRTLDVGFEQPCYDGAQRRPALRGRWQYRAGDTSPFADWLVPGSRPGLGEPPPEDPLPEDPLPEDPAGSDQDTAAPTATAPSPAPPSGPTVASTTGTGSGASGATAATPSAAARPLSAPAARRAVATCRRRAQRRVLGTVRADLLRGSARGDRLLGRGGRDRLFGRGGDDCLHGGAGGDRLYGGTGRDAIFGGPGNDVLVGGPGSDALDCGPGRHDRAVAGPGDRTRGCELVRRVTR